MPAQSTVENVRFPLDGKFSIKGSCLPAGTHRAAGTYTEPRLGYPLMTDPTRDNSGFC